MLIPPPNILAFICFSPCSLPPSAPAPLPRPWYWLSETVTALDPLVHPHSTPQGLSKTQCDHAPPQLRIPQGLLISVEKGPERLSEGPQPLRGHQSLQAPPFTLTPLYPPPNICPPSNLSRSMSSSWQLSMTPSFVHPPPVDVVSPLVSCQSF